MTETSCTCGHDLAYHGNRDQATGWQARCGSPDCDCEDYARRPPVQLTATPTIKGCTAPGCDSQRTVQLHPYHGRQCPEHVTLPPGPFRADLAADMVAMGHPSAAFAYLRAWLDADIDRKFDRLRQELGMERAS